MARDETEPAYLNQLKALFKRHPNTTIIWAHTGLGRAVAPAGNHLALIEAILHDPNFRNVYADLSWDEVRQIRRRNPRGY